MVDPNCAKVFGYNAYVVVNVLFIAFTTTVIATGLSGIFRDGHVSSDNGGLHAYMKPLFFVGCVTVGNLKTYIVVRNADRVRALFGVADQSFLLGGRRQPIHPKLVSSGRRFNRLIFPWYFLTFFITALLWITIPIVVNNCGQHPADGAWIRKNVINFWYPVTADTYDRFYYVFYAAEGLMVVYSTYVLVAFDLFLIAILQLMAAQYEIMSAAYERLDFKNGNKHGECPHAYGGFPLSVFRSTNISVFRPPRMYGNRLYFRLAITRILLSSAILSANHYIGPCNRHESHESTRRHQARR